MPEDIAAASGAGPGTGVLEVGPGIGPLTRQLARRADKVASVELDRSLLPILKETLADCPNAEIVPGDILKTDIPALVEEKFAGLKAVACANLPYNITTPAITALIEAGCFQSITVMIQREVARAHLRQAGHGGLWGLLRLLPVSHRAGVAVRRAPRVLHPRPERSPPPCCAWSPAPRRRRWMTRSTSSGWCGPPMPSGGRPWSTDCTPPLGTS